MKKTILITGGAKRIGANICRLIAKIANEKNFYNIIIHYNTSEVDAINLKSELKNLSEYVEVFLFQADFSKIENVQFLIDFIKNNFEKLDILVNNASLFAKDNFSSNDHIYEKYINIHVNSVFLLSKFAISCGRCTIINMLDKRRSEKFVENFGNYFYYSMTKHMMFVVHEYMKKNFETNPEIKIHGILVDFVLPNENDVDFFEKNQIDKQKIEQRNRDLMMEIKDILLY